MSEQRQCAGTDNVDLEKAKELAIKVVHVPSYSPHAVAEFAVGMMLTVIRKYHKAYNRVREGNFSLSGKRCYDTRMAQGSCFLLMLLQKRTRGVQS